MRPSPLRHPLAVLRQTIGISQKELADIIGRSPSTIQAIELLKLNLSEDLAAKIENETGASADWLLSGDVNRPIKNSLGASYLKEDYELARAKRSKLPAHVDATTMEMCHASGLICGERLARVFAGCNASEAIEIPSGDVFSLEVDRRDGAKIWRTRRGLLGIPQSP